MNSLRHAKQLAIEGRFSDAFKTLEGASIGAADRTAADVLKAEILQQLGKSQPAKTRVEALLRSKSLSARDRSLCYFVLGRIDADDGRLESAAGRLQKAAAIALEAKDFERAAWSQCRLLLILSDASGLGVVGPLLAELRANVLRTGSPTLLAALHIHIAQTEAKRSLLSSAQRHIAQGFKILQTTPNAWLESMAEHIEATIWIVRSEFGKALSHAQRAVELACQSGQAAIHGASLGNFGHLLYLTGDLNRAFEYSERAVSMFPPGTDNFSGALETLARIRLAENRTDECEQLLDRIESFVVSESDRARYVYRHSLLTHAQSSLRKGELHQSLAAVEKAVHLAEKTGDRWLWHSAMLFKADLLRQLADLGGTVAILNRVAETLASQPPDIYAAYESVIACALAANGEAAKGQSHFDRAKRIYEVLGHRPGLLELERCWTNALATATAFGRSLTSATAGPHDQPASRSIATTLQTVSALTLHAERPDLLAREVVDVLDACECVRSALAVRVASDGSETVLCRIGHSEAGIADDRARRMIIDTDPEREIGLVIWPKSDIDSVSTVNAVLAVVRTLKELRDARREREERAALWPVDELPTEGDRTVIIGHMREQMTFAQRIARTTVNVLITGESGTGKEILARAIHTFSDRAKKPFVPFNCAAVPRDLMETQLFGHRRGAFTGAERDHAGLIRGARDGTLFLDEIGELSLDLQPKLLRFLESGEIAPLGEPGPLNVNVRVVAATNANLEDAVRDGRFREDLFYRLNVVRLSIKPLRERRDEIPTLVNRFVAHAAEEFKKGHIQVAEDTMERLILYRWPGNVRQLQNELRRMVALAEPNSTLPPDAIAEEILAALPIVRHPKNGREMAVPLHDKLLPTLSRIETEMIKAALREHHGKVDAVAKALGISRKGLYLKRQRLGL